LAVPVATVLTVGDRVRPDKLASRFSCCANAGIDINDTTNIPSENNGVYLLIGNFNSLISIIIVSKHYV
jgi:hypothetical protein